MTQKRKNHPARWFFEGSETGKFLNRGNSLVRDVSPNLSFQCSRSNGTTSRTLTTSLAHPVYQWLPPMAICRAFSGWTQVDSYRKERGSRTERGVRAHSPAWSERPKPSRDTSSVSYEKAPRFLKGKKAEQVSGKRQGRNRRAHEGVAGEKSPASLSPVGFRLPLTCSVHFCDARQGRRSLWKNAIAHPFFSVLLGLHVLE